MPNFHTLYYIRHFLTDVVFLRDQRWATLAVLDFSLINEQKYSPASLSNVTYRIIFN